MLFNSYVFIFAFLPIVLIGFEIARRRLDKTSVLAWIILCSLFYYSWWEPKFLLLILVTVSVNVLFAKQLVGRSSSLLYRKSILTISILFNIGLLGYYKYSGFIITNINQLMNGDYSIAEVMLPIGISFITFQIIAFQVDAYRGKVERFKILEFGFFVTFFPQLIAGPIVHHSEVIPQLANLNTRKRVNDVAIGSCIFIVGLFKKVVVADTLAVYADAGYMSVAAGQSLDFASAWIAVLSYSFQLYFDFSGYSDMAVGLARIFGIKLPVNFFSPYKSASIIEFWRRWHITLSRFLRDYLYIPLGGNRVSRPRQQLNVALVMLLGGLWHGASWNFVIWGAVHGGLLAINHGWRRTPFMKSKWMHSKPIKPVLIAITFLCVTLAWVPFRASSLTEAVLMFDFLFPNFLNAAPWQSLLEMFNAQFVDVWSIQNVLTWLKAAELWPNPMPENYLAISALPAGLVLSLIALFVFGAPNTYQIFEKFDPAIWSKSDQVDGKYGLSKIGFPHTMLLGFMLVLSILGLSRVSPFLYFQF